MIEEDFYCIKNYKNNKGHNVHRKTFDDTQKLVKYLKNGEVNTNIFDHTSSTKRKERGFNDFDSLQDAISALEFGTDIYFDKFNIEFKKINEFIKKHSKSLKPKFKNDLVGFMPIVPNYILGNPVDMINQEYTKKVKPTITLVVEKAMTCGYSSDNMISFSCIIFNLVQYLERKGIRVELYVSSVFKCEREIFANKIKIKSFNQPLNIYRLQFPVIATDMFRRVGFRLLETCKELKNHSWSYGYGSTTLCKGNGYDIKQSNGEVTYTDDLKELLDITEDDILIPAYDYFDYRKDDKLSTTIKNIINATKLKNYINIK